MKLTAKLFLATCGFIAWIWISSIAINWIPLHDPVWPQFFASLSLFLPSVFVCFLIELLFIWLITRFNVVKMLYITTILQGASTVINAYIMLTIGFITTAYEFPLNLIIYAISALSTTVFVGFCIELLILRLFTPITKRTCWLLLCSNIAKALVVALCIGLVIAAIGNSGEL